MKVTLPLATPAFDVRETAHGLPVIPFRSAAMALIVACAVLAVPAASEGADGADRLSTLARLRGDVREARGPAAYVALRRVWSEWDRGDPIEVEEVLHEAALDPGTPAPVRVYAALLEAYARRRRGDLDGAHARIEKLGYVGRWMLVGPFDNDGKTGLLTEYDPEREQTLALNLTRDYEGKEHHPVRWRLGRLWRLRAPSGAGLRLCRDVRA
jgi:hypothetical protein